ncbi:MAG: bifunctional folylpolyglutamate synthase/dihydrofolate synthase [Muribaculaceae bacterium]|nr:bifunctional folylpolyglutamate synthase/dihydrofolate synthase [Muribaculaceae bacterium]
MDNIETEYNLVLEDLYGRLQAFHRVGSAAYKPGLDTAHILAEAFGNPHHRFKTIHVGGTNGKGSTAHLLAAILSAAGYRTGLYTSPHLVDFNERIRVDGRPIPHEKVINFIRRWEQIRPDCDPSFFELSTIMAFDYFAACEVDVAVIEVGLGGRLDTTNIITPELSIITNISLDHTSILGNTISAIAREKAGIFKNGVPALVGEADEDSRRVFETVAGEVRSPLTFAQDSPQVLSHEIKNDILVLDTRSWGTLDDQLTGDCQNLNANTVLKAIDILISHGWKISPEAVCNGLANVCNLTGLMGRWMKLQSEPTVICDTGHNPGAWQYLTARLGDIARDRTLHIVLGFVGDKDYRHIIPTLPSGARYYMVTSSTPRAVTGKELCAIAREAGLEAQAYDSVIEGYEQAIAHAATDDTIFVGGSTFVVADLLKCIDFISR